MTSRATASHEACPEMAGMSVPCDAFTVRHHTTLIATDVRLLGEYGLLPRLALQAMLPLRIVGTRTRYTDLLDQPITLAGPSIHHRNETIAGLGDAQLLLHRAFKAGPFAFGARAGVSIPLGEVHENPYALGDAGLPHQHVQFGTGTWDPVVALDASVTLSKTTLSAFGGLQAPLYQGPQGYRAGARSMAGVVASRPFGSLTLRLGADLLHERPERWNGRIPLDDGNQGRTDLYVSPGLTWNFAGEWMLSADVRVRAFSHVVNAQLDMPVVLQIGLGRLLHLERGEHEEKGGAAHAEHDARHAEKAPAGDVADAVHAGEAAQLRAVPGKWTVFDFWAVWCEACKPLDAGLRALAAKRPGVALRRINVVDFKSPIAKQELAGVSQLPHVRLVSPSGVVAYEASGPADELLREIESRTR